MPSRTSVFARYLLIIYLSRTSKLLQTASGLAFTGRACAAALPPLEMLCDIEADLLLKICEELPFQHVPMMPFLPLHIQPPALYNILSSGHVAAVRVSQFAGVHRFLRRTSSPSLSVFL
jgi:hypothetical protein